MNNNNSSQEWDIEIKPKANLLEIDFKGLWKYRDLIILFVRRDLKTVYQQTVLGPAWYIIQPLFTTVVFSLIFNNIAGIKTGQTPAFLFYLGGTCLWNYFNETLTTSSKALIENSGIFGKVYFPRLALPISRVLSGFFKFLIQMGLFLAFYIYFLFFTDVHIKPNFHLFFIPYLIVLIMFLGLGFGLIISSISTKYRDFQHLIGFGMQLLMYGSPIIYPMAKVTEKWYGVYIWFNPLSSIIETFRYGFFGDYTINLAYLAYSSLFAIIVLAIGIIMFNRSEKSFMDTV